MPSLSVASFGGGGGGDLLPGSVAVKVGEEVEVGCRCSSVGGEDATAEGCGPGTEGEPAVVVAVGTRWRNSLVEELILEVEVKDG